MHIHILGIGGTFMAGIALLAQQQGHKVTGSDRKLYPPMNQQLASHNIQYSEQYAVEDLQPHPDLVIIGNALSRGNPCVEYVLEQGLRYISAPQWLAEQVLVDKWVIAVAGTHGKTTTSSLVAWILHYAGLQPSFLIGGIANNFNLSARLTDSPFFVIEADEYDTAFFDKRSKFLHYAARTVILNNLEFDHADIFTDLAAIQRQFAHFMRIIPGSGLVIHPLTNSIQEVLAAGCWSEQVSFAHDAEWEIGARNLDYSEFEVLYQRKLQAKINWQCIGLHNAHNAIAAIVAARHVGVNPQLAAAALTEFRSVKRRLELIADFNNIEVYDDFAHHPSAINATLTALRQKVGTDSIAAVVDIGSNSMRMGVYRNQLAPALQIADQVYFYQAVDLSWSLRELNLPQAQYFNDIPTLIAAVLQQPAQHILIMSNTGFANLNQNLITALQSHIH